MERRIYILYDGRAWFGDTDDASVCSVSYSLQEVHQDRDDFFEDGVIYSYSEDENGYLIDERFEG